ncbi:MAG: hypothetical protein VBE63_21185 [Lamprobacter sp.]|uniref:SOS response-associated peptidase family protein n=1 Tax=Lamprobacter sp. TaxID=3100796 RepID=UPI002B25BE96|nr:SOS response-associated peptidase family protein [Lamprobacter sp.]MEA3642435.1 hypothetical protein [Lamprobacter sp.]
MRQTDRMPFAMAGLFEHWQGEDGSVIDSCTIIVTEANQATIDRNCLHPSRQRHVSNEQQQDASAHRAGSHPARLR